VLIAQAVFFIHSGDTDTHTKSQTPLITLLMARLHRRGQKLVSQWLWTWTKTVHNHNTKQCRIAQSASVRNQR